MGRKRQDAVRETAERAAPARLDDVRRDWSMREQAWLKAMNDAPAHGGNGGDAVEARVAAEYAEAANRVRETVQMRVNAALAEIARLRATLDAAPPDEAEARGRFQLGVARAEHEDDLIAAEREVIAAARDQRVFRARHQLAREPQLPQDKLISAAWLALVLVLEAAFNTPFFYVGGQSLIGSVFEGLLVAGANVALGFLAGVFGLRGLAHRFVSPWRILGLGVLLSALAAALGLNGLMAMRRMTAAEHSVGSGDAAAELLASLDPLVLTLAFSTFAAIGFLFAAYKGWQGFFEPYPGYGHVARRLERARRRLEDIRQDFQEAAVASMQEVKEDLEDELDDDRDAAAAMRRVAAEAEEAELQAVSALEELKSRARWLITRYREAAAQITGEPAAIGDPDPVFEAPPPSAQRVRDALADAEARLEANEAAYARGLADLSALMSRFDEEMASAMDGVRRQAQARDRQETGLEDGTGEHDAARAHPA